MRKASLGTIIFTVFLDLIGFGLVVPYLPGVARSLGATDFVATLVGSAYSLMQFLFVPFWGRLSDQRGRRPILLASIGGSAIGMMLLAGADSLWMVFLARIWSGIATSNISVAQAYIADVTAKEDRAKGMGLIGAGIGLGFVLGPALGGLLEAVSPLSRVGALPALFAAGLSAVNFLLALRYLPESLPMERRGLHARSRSPIDMDRFRIAFGVSGIGPAILVNFVVALSFSGLEQTFRLFTADEFGMQARETGYVLGFVGFILVSVQGAAMRPLARITGERMLVQLGVFTQAIGFACLAASPSYGAMPLYGSMGLIALGSGFSNPGLSTFVSKIGTDKNQGVLLSALQSAGALARVSGPAVGGLIYQNLGHRGPYVAASIGMAIATLLAMGLRKPERTAQCNRDGVATQP